MLIQYPSIIVRYSSSFKIEKNLKSDSEWWMNEKIKINLSISPRCAKWMICVCCFGYRKITRRNWFYCARRFQNGLLGRSVIASDVLCLWCRVKKSNSKWMIISDQIQSKVCADDHRCLKIISNTVLSNMVYCYHVFIPAMVSNNHFDDVLCFDSQFNRTMISAGLEKLKWVKWW